MGKQGNMKFIGTVENIIYYQWKNIYAVRTKPTTVKQTGASIEQSKLFGMAAHTGAVLRSLLKPALPNAKDRNMMRRFEQAIAGWLRTGAYNSNEPQNNLPFITGFEFNEQSLLQNKCKLPVTVNRTQQNAITVAIPALMPTKDIAAPSHTTKVTIKLRAAACSMSDDNSSSSSGKQVTIAYNNTLLPAQKIKLPVTPVTGNITLILLALEYTVKKNGVEQILKDLKWLPAGIVGSMWS